MRTTGPAFASPCPIALNQEPKSGYEAAKELREAQLRYAAVSIGRRYEHAQQVTRVSTAERVASIKE